MSVESKFLLFSFFFVFEILEGEFYKNQYYYLIYHLFNSILFVDGLILEKSIVITIFSNDLSLIFCY